MDIAAETHQDEQVGAKDVVSANTRWGVASLPSTVNIMRHTLPGLKQSLSQTVPATQGIATRRSTLMQPGIIIAVTLIQGLLYLFLLPPWQHYDEPTHFEYAWLIANTGRRPTVDDIDQAMRREVQASMLAHNFYANLSLPDLNAEKINIGITELHHPPLYYMLVSLPLRFVSDLDMASQLYVARAVSLVLFGLTILVVLGVMRDLTPPGHALRWIVPLSVALLPTFVDNMTSVNNDVGAVLIVSLFLWGALRMVRYGITGPHVLWVCVTAILALLTKSTAMVTVLLIAPVILVTWWSRHGWSWPWLLVVLVGLGIAGGMILVWRDDAATWYRWGGSQISATRVASTAAGLGTHAFQVETGATPSSPLLLAPVLHDQVDSLAGQTVTVGGWVWADRPVTAHVFGLSWSEQGSSQVLHHTQPVTLTTTPTFMAHEFSIPQQTGVLYYTLTARPTKPDTAPLRVYLDGALIVEGQFDASMAPVFDDPTALAGTWHGQPFRNLVRNASAEQCGMRLSPWFEQLLVKYTKRSPSRALTALLDVQQHGHFLVANLTDQVVFGFFGRFAWGHVGLPGALWLRVFQAMFVIGLGASIAWFWRIQPATESYLRPALVLLGMAGLLIWLNTFLWPLPYLYSAKLPLTSSRYTFPSIIPTMLLLAGGWYSLWPRSYRMYGGLIFVLALLALNIWAVVVIYSYYY